MDSDINDLFTQRQREIGRLVQRHSSGEGMHASAIEGVHCIRFVSPQVPLPTVYRPCFCVIVQGMKQVLLGDEVYRYAPSQFLAVSVDLPLVSQVLQATEEAPYLCLAIDLDAGQFADLIAKTGSPPRASSEPMRGLFVGQLDADTQDTVLRLSRLLDSPRDIPVLAPLLLRELHFRLLSSPYADAIAQAAMVGSGTQRIAQVIRRLSTELAAPVRIDELAAMANMSRSAFHAQFKAVTAMSPLQFQKRLRLTEARQLLLSGQADAATTAYRVGYQSVSQFSREYTRQFGAPPIRDVTSLRGA